MNQIPEIRIRFSRLMYEKVSKDLFAMHRPGQIIATVQQCEDKAASYREEWAKYHAKILNGLQELLGLTFYLPVIDVTVAPMIPAFSTPLIINLRPDRDQFVDVLTHELIHVLVSDNRQELDIRAVRDELLPEEEILISNHVIVHAVHHQIYLDVLGAAERLQRDIKLCQANPPYKRAWELVDKMGAKEIVGKIRQAAGH